MKLFLTSAGFQPETKEKFLKLLGKDPKETLVAFIPTAAGPDKNKDYVRWTIDQIKELGMKAKTIDLVDENEQSLNEKLSDCDVIIVNGGNTFFLLEWVKKSGFDKVIRPLLEQGKIYVGISAGSYIACPTIEQSKWKHLDDPDKASRTDLSALDLVNFLIVAHYTDEYKEVIGNGVKTTNCPVVVLTDQQAIVIDGDSIELAGPEPVLKYNGFKFTGE